MAEQNEKSNSKQEENEKFIPKDQIEISYLLGRLNELIKEVDGAPSKPYSSKLANLHTKFQKLKEAVENQLKNPSLSSKITKENLYTLNNLLSEYLSQLPNTFSLNPLVFNSDFSSALDSILGGEKSQHSSQSQHLDGAPSLHRKESEAETAAVAEAEADTATVAEAEADGPMPEAEVALEANAYRWSVPYVDEGKVLGLKDKEVVLRRLILDENAGTGFRKFGLVGMRGMGKTTLAQVVFNHQDVRSHFLPRIWVCLSKQPEEDEDPRKEIVTRMLRRLGVDDEIISFADEKHGLKGLLYSLRQQLSGKRYLIVLDDVCNQDESCIKFVSGLKNEIGQCKEELAYGLPKECGGAIIVTSRSKKIACTLVGEENIHQVLRLSDEDCWEIYKNTLKEGDEAISANKESLEKKIKWLADMESLKKKITDKCHGLPLAAKMMGEIARRTMTLRTTPHDG